MEAAHHFTDDKIFSGTFAAIADALARLPGDATRPDAASKPSRTAPVEEVRIGLAERIDRWFWRQQQRDIEAFLARSRDVFELEQRIRDIDRAFRGRSF